MATAIRSDEYPKKKKKKYTKEELLAILSSPSSNKMIKGDAPSGLLEMAGKMMYCLAFREVS